MAAGIISRLEPFDCRNGDFDYYLEQFDHFLMLNSIEDAAKKVPLFITSIGQDAYRILKESCEPMDPKEKSFEELKAALQQYFARRQFYNRNQRPNEQLGAFINDVKRLSLKCSFGPFSKEALRDRIACGKLSEDKTDKPAPSPPAPVPVQPKAAPAPAPETAVAKPKQPKKPKAPQITGQEVVVPATEGQKQMRPPKAGEHRCKICGHAHKEADCAHKDASCFLCRKKGHIASVCREKHQKKNQPSQPVQVHVHVQQTSAMKNE
ncbi:uncharacterized protein LOC129725543 [Wyeomyia smithii]|uniref:uncharacterized protein LOC129725542 n=1 Tax=Wyeomyia smithii TaxID=174621 RepID=UPI0024681059|nr:uncharacterized protein LOC129725542 [Wyeomyia smithii]XP_055537494.1 uncharacterized protein LOC129725543 [Wyeomyia smithii]